MDQDPQSLSTGAIAAIFSGITAIITAIAMRGGPVVVAWLNRSDALEAMRTSQAKEGPLMVIARLEIELKETKDELSEVKAEMKANQKDHSNCQNELASLRVTVKYQNDAIVKLEQRLTQIDGQTP